MRKQLVRSETNKMVAGICGGLADYFDIDATLFRILFVVTTFLGGAGVLVYVLLWIIIPTSSSQSVDPKARVTEFKNEAERFVQSTADQIRKSTQDSGSHTAARTQQLIAIALVVLGILIIVKNILPHISFTFVWPGILVLLGVWLLWQAQPTSQTGEDTEEPEEKTDEKKDKEDEDSSDTPTSESK